jgi:predicted transcriptional regulator
VSGYLAKFFTCFAINCVKCFTKHFAKRYIKCFVKQGNMEHFTNQKQNREAAIDFMLTEKGF